MATSVTSDTELELLSCLKILDTRFFRIWLWKLEDLKKTKRMCPWLRIYLIIATTSHPLVFPDQELFSASIAQPLSH
jgi:hypothetical protein